MGMRALKVLPVIMTTPQMALVIIGYQQALAVMPAVTEDIVILLALGAPFLFAQAIPLAMRMLLKEFGDGGRENGPVASGFKEEAVVNVHQAIDAEIFNNTTQPL